ncbi:T9SS type A sorting domain-containing protein [Rufibacter hautae]|uniref:T9SS type A sorting domain-containing protein n=1 Tax=Rufibacter hautae TaxID=2595005 RepID=A0A5B6TJ72_9BACT|nr:T9SS type A sorting domain-containing protein [Rufibacter hautae]KAA3440461.1 T9SS type A sorting domain-containing protein [Rufibacter hautae]
MIRNFTRLKEVMYVTLCLVLASGALSYTYGSSHYARAAKSKNIRSILNLAQLAWTPKGESAAELEDTTATGKTYYWVPFGATNRGSGAWSELGHWATTSGGKVKHQTLPTAADNIVFDINSFLFTGQKVTLDQEANVNNISWTGIRATNFDGNGQTLNVHGALQANLDLTFTGTKGFLLNFKTATENAPLNFEGRLFAPGTVLTFDGSGSWDLQSQIRVSANGTINLQQGSLKTNGYPISINAFNSVSDKARSLDLGNSALENLSTWNVSPSLTLKADSAAFTINGPETHIFNGGGKSYKLVTLHGPRSYVNHSNTFKSITLPKQAIATESNTLVLEAGQNQTIESLFTFGAGSLTTIQSSVAGQTANVNFSSFGFCTDYLTISDVTATGPGAYYAGLSSQSIGNTTGWNFLSCGSAIYTPKSTSDYNACKSSASVTSTGSGTWQEIKFEGEVVATFNDGGNSLGEVSLDFAVSSENARTLKSTDGADIKALARNWRLKSTTAPSADKPVRIRFYGLKSEVEAYQNAVPEVTTLENLSFTTYSSSGPSENCLYTDNTEAGSITNHLLGTAFSSTGNYFTAEVAGITDFSEFYLHNGYSAIDFVASQPVKEEPVATVEEMDFIAHWNAKTVKLKWMAPGKITATYDVERASSPESKEFETIISKAPRQNSANAATAVYHAEDFSPAAGPANYYRLKRTNADGTFTYSQTVKVDNKAYTAAVQASPNPFTDKVKLTVNAEKAGEMSVKLMTEYGEVALEKKIKVAKGTSASDLVIGAKVKSGIYLLVTELNGERLTQRLIKQ